MTVIKDAAKAVHDVETDASSMAAKFAQLNANRSNPDTTHCRKCLKQSYKCISSRSGLLRFLMATSEPV